MGLSVWVEIEPRVDVVINSIRTQGFHPDFFTGLGVDLGPKRLVVVKSSQHFETGFSPIADLVLPVATPGTLQMDFAAIDYRKKRDMDFFPRVPDPLGLGG
jgi:microcystin degradation protein MlrC